MFVKIDKLEISMQNSAARPHIETEVLYINSSSILSIADYEGIKSFLQTEGSRYASEDFSLLKLTQGSKIIEMIAFGTARALCHKFEKDTPASAKLLLND